MLASEEKELPMEGRIVLITGATSGIGKATSIGLAEMGAELVIVGRNKERTDIARKEIISRSANKNIATMICDLSSMNDVRNLARSFNETHDRLDVLVNNAGGGSMEKTVDGYEMIFALDYLSPFLLTNLLLDPMKRSDDARIVTVSSGLHKGGEIDFEDLMPEKISVMKAYSQAKLAEVLFTYELARRLKGTRITTNCCDPGGTRTGLGKSLKGFGRAFWIMMYPFLKSSEKGAQTSIYLASSSELKGITGKYYVKMQERSSSPASYDEQAALRLWNISEELTGLGGKEMK